MDYLALAATLHTLVLTAVPRLSVATKDAARRFIVLIDTCYDRKVRHQLLLLTPFVAHVQVRLLLSAEASAELLFVPQGDDSPSHSSRVYASPLLSLHPS